MDQVRNDPALAGNVDWQGVEEQYREWNETQEGLTGAASALIAIAIAAATMGTGLAASISTAVAGAVGSTALGAAVSAGAMTLMSQATISLINNKGDLGGVFKDLTSSASLKSLAISMLSAGLMSGVGGLLNTDLAASATDLSFVEQARNVLVRATINAGVENVVNGGDLGEGFLEALKMSAVAALGANVANKIGNLYNPTIEDVIAEKSPLEYFSHKIAHAALGCAMGAAQSSDGCVAGATGAVVGEVVAEVQLENWVADKIQDFGKMDLNTISMDELREIRRDFKNEKQIFREHNIDTAKFTGALAAFVTGQDVNIAASTAENAAENNNTIALGAAAGAWAGPPGVVIGGAGGLAVAILIWMVMDDDSESDFPVQSSSSGATAGASGNAPDPDDFDPNQDKKGSTTSNKDSKLKSEIKRGQAPKGVERYDVGKVKGEQSHIHFNNGGALNKNGTWKHLPKHGNKALTNKQMKWLKKHGWKLP